MNLPLDRLWVAATLAELRCAPGAEELAEPLANAPWSGWIMGGSAFLVSGAGPVAAAATLSGFLALHPSRSVVGIGIAGLYPGSPLRRDGVYLVVRDGLPEHGAESGDGSLLTLDFPGLRERSFPSEAPTDLAHLPTAEGLTTGLATGTARTALRRRATGADVESMEGAAWAFAAAQAGTPFAQVRSISNLAGFRDRDSWDIPGALRRLRAALRGGAPGTA